MGGKKGEIQWKTGKGGKDGNEEEGGLHSSEATEDGGGGGN